MNYRLSVHHESYVNNAVAAEFYAIDDEHAGVVARAISKALVARDKDITRENLKLTKINK